MTSAAKKVLEAREEFVGTLLTSLEPVTSSPEWQSEIARRLRMIENGEAIFYDAEAHLRSLQARYGR